MRHKLLILLAVHNSHTSSIDMHYSSCYNMVVGYTLKTG
jgi:hypothetical protein